MFKKILIANRGEIACRIMKTARRMGIATVAIYSDADASALHVAEADEAVRVGPAAVAESYLNVEAILSAIKQTGAEAVHPGFGFLAENADFATRLQNLGVVFIGPPPAAIAAMGDKIESKKLAAVAGVSTIPGNPNILHSEDEAASAAQKIGFPVMLKASAGGGGKGMRIAHNEAEARAGFVSAANEARSAFGDDRVFAEKFIEQPRHIEIQIIADGHGNIVYLGERECSLQRRHQKVIEEAPSPFLDDKTRAAMGEQAVALASAVDYVSAGTVEFVADKDRNFYFLEMNTRLQVEHPVTEYVTGLDLVELMIAVAAGEHLPFTQQDIKPAGWAIEARIYAEDPERNFMPSIGRLNTYLPPQPDGNLRLDSGVTEGSEISVYYDPMIAKLVVGSQTRERARLGLLNALDCYFIDGVTHNIPFLSALLSEPAFVEGEFTTAFIDQRFPDGFNSTEIDYPNPDNLIAIAAVLQAIESTRSGEYPRDVKQRPIKYTVFGAGKEIDLTVTQKSAEFEVEMETKSIAIACDWQPGFPILKGTANGDPFTVQVRKRKSSWTLSHRGYSADILVVRPNVAKLYRLMPKKQIANDSKFLLSPMPGLLVRLAVKAGDEVKLGQELAVVEAMKMENTLVANRDGTIGSLLATLNDNLAVDQPILEFE